MECIERELSKVSERQNELLHIYKNQGLIFSGISEFDNQIKGFQTQKKYLFVAQAGMGLFSFSNTIEKYMKVLYPNLKIKTYSNILNENNFQSNSVFQTLIIKSEKQTWIELSDIPKKIQNYFDVIIAIYRPEYFGIEKLYDETTTSNKIQFKTIKNIDNKEVYGILKLDTLKKEVKSFDTSFFKKWNERLMKELNK
jgi:hypothetical protein